MTEDGLLCLLSARWRTQDVSGLSYHPIGQATTTMNDLLQGSTYAGRQVDRPSLRKGSAQTTRQRVQNKETSCGPWFWTLNKRIGKSRESQHR